MSIRRETKMPKLQKRNDRPLIVAVILVVAVLACALGLRSDQSALEAGIRTAYLVFAGLVALFAVFRGAYINASQGEPR